MIKISLVSYSNTLPFKYGIEQSEYLNKYARVFYDNPAECANKLINNKVDIGLIPVAAMQISPNFYRISDYCLAAKEKVKSVLLLSDEPIDKLKRIYLDYQSMTSVNLLKILMIKYWKKTFELINTEQGYEQKINGKNGGIMIGDRALNLQNYYKYSYDLAEEWFNFTGLPAVFAVWVANKNIDKNFIKKFNASLKIGVDNIPDVIAKENKQDYRFDLEDYLLNYIDYKLDNKKHKSIDLFLDFLDF